MKTNRQAQREAKQLFGLCVVDGSLDDARVRQVVEKVVAAGRPGGLKVLSRFQRLREAQARGPQREGRERQPHLPEIQAQIESELARMYGRGLLMSFAERPDAARWRAHHGGQRRL